MVCDLPNYKLLRCDHIGHTGNGSCIIFNTEIYSVVSSNTYNSNDYSIVQAAFDFCCFKKSSFIVICCYLSPTRDSLEVDRDCTSIFVSALQSTLSTNFPNIQQGDFNLHINWRNPKISGKNADHMFSKFPLRNGLHQYVNEVTYGTSIIDCIFCDNNEILHNVH